MAVAVGGTWVRAVGAISSVPESDGGGFVVPSKGLGGGGGGGDAAQPLCGKAARL